MAVLKSRDLGVPASRKVDIGHGMSRRLAGHSSDKCIGSSLWVLLSIRSVRSPCQLPRYQVDGPTVRGIHLISMRVARYSEIHFRRSVRDLLHELLLITGSLYYPSRCLHLWMFRLGDYFNCRRFEFEDRIVANRFPTQSSISESDPVDTCPDTFRRRHLLRVVRVVRGFPTVSSCHFTTPVGIEIH